MQTGCYRQPKDWSNSAAASILIVQNGAEEGKVECAWNIVMKFLTFEALNNVRAVQSVYHLKPFVDLVCV